MTRPTRWARRAANPASSVLLVPPSDCARASHSSASRKIVAVGSVMRSSRSGERRRWPGVSGAVDPPRPRLRRANRAAATTARPIAGMSRAVWRASSRSACHRRRDAGGRPADRVVVAGSRVRQRFAQPDAVGEAMGDDQAHSRAAVGEREHREVPSGSVLGIQRGVGLLAEPGVEFFTRPRRRDDLEVGLTAGRDPAMAAERQG